MAESPPFGAIGDRHRAGSHALDSALAEIATIWANGDRDLPWRVVVRQIATMWS
jgi:hypothetical protein